MSNPKDLFTITRETAAEQLAVSTRTLDRWLKSGKLKFKTVNRQVFVHEHSLANAAAKLAKKAQRAAKEVLGKTAKMDPQIEQKTTNESLNESRSEPVFAHQVSFETPSAAEEKVFRELYTQVAAELKTKQEKLEAAGFRVGQLEAQLQNSVPLLEHKQAFDSIQAENIELKNKVLAERMKAWIALGGFLLTAIVAITLAFFLAR